MFAFFFSFFFEAEEEDEEETEKMQNGKDRGKGTNYSLWAVKHFLPCSSAGAEFGISIWSPKRGL